MTASHFPSAFVHGRMLECDCKSSFLSHYFEGQLGGSGDMQLPKLIIDLRVVSSLVKHCFLEFLSE